MAVKPFKRVLAVTASLMAMALAAAPMGLAGEDEGDDEDSAPAQSSGGGGGSDSGSASGGVQTGVGGMVAATEPGASIPIALAGGGVVFLTLAGGLASRKRRFE
jgi:hypothetical protein